MLYVTPVDKNTEKLTHNLGSTQLKLLTALRLKDIETALKIDWSVVYPTLKTLKVLGLINYDNEIYTYDIWERELQKLKNPTPHTKENILHNIKLETIKTWNNNNDIKDEWKRTATKYKCKITFKNQSYVFSFWMGAAHTQPPTKKDVLYSFIMDDVSYMDFDEFCSCFGYDNDSIKALKNFRACEEQTKNVNRLFNEEEKEMLRELLKDY